MSSWSVCGILFVTISVGFAMYTARLEKYVPTLPGNCPDFSPTGTPFDFPKVLGLWFRLYFAVNGLEYNKTQKCVNKSVTATPDGKLVTFFTGIIDEQTINIPGIITTQPEAEKNGKFTFQDDTADSANGHKLNITGTIIATDYTGFMVSVMCGTDGTKHGYVVVVESRTKTLDASGLEKAKASMKTANLKGDLKPIESC